MAARPAPSRAAVDEVFRWRAVSPRLGVSLKLNESGTAPLKAHYGRYYRGIVTGEFDNTTPSITPKYALLGSLQRRRDSRSDKELVSDNSSLTVDPDLKNPYTDQFIVAWEQQSGRTSGFR